MFSSQDAGRSLAELLQGSVDVDVDVEGGGVVGVDVVLGGGDVVSRVVDGDFVEWLVGCVNDGIDEVELELGGGGPEPVSLVVADPGGDCVLGRLPSLGWVRTGINVVLGTGSWLETTGCTGSAVVP